MSSSWAPFRDQVKDPLDRLVTPANEKITEAPFSFWGETGRRVGEFLALFEVTLPGKV